MADIAKIKRQCTKGTLTRFINFFHSIKDKPVEQINFEELQSRLIKAESLLDDFNDSQLILEAADEHYDTNADTLHANERTLFEHWYSQAIYCKTFSGRL